MKSKPPVTVREALAAVMLEEVDSMLARQENILLGFDAMAQVQRELVEQVRAATTAYEGRIHDLGEAARLELTTFVESRTAQEVDKARLAILEGVRAALAQPGRSQLSDDLQHAVAIKLRSAYWMSGIACFLGVSAIVLAARGG